MMRFMCLYLQFAFFFWRSPLSQFSTFVCRLLPRRPAARPGLLCAAGLRQLSVSGAPGPLLPAPDCRPSPLAESALLPLAEARCAFKESRLLAVTLLAVSQERSLPARLTEKKTNNFSFVCGGYFPLDPLPRSSSPFKDLNANGGLKPLDPCGFGSLVRPPSSPPALRLFLPHCFSGVLCLFKHGGGGAVDSPPLTSHFPAPSLKGRESK